MAPIKVQKVFRNWTECYDVICTVFTRGLIFSIRRIFSKAGWKILLRLCNNLENYKYRLGHERKPKTRTQQAENWNMGNVGLCWLFWAVEEKIKTNEQNNDKAFRQQQNNRKIVLWRKSISSYTSRRFMNRNKCKILQIFQRLRECLKIIWWIFKKSIQS